MPRLLLLVLVALAVCAVTPGSRAAERTSVTTVHFALTTAGPAEEADEWGRVLEASWPQMTEFFGAAPKFVKDERMRVAVFEDDASFRAAIVAGGGVAPSSGGYYCPIAKTSYLKRQPTRWYTRNLLLHEAAHQFHYRARTGNAKPHGSWYIEGLAEHLGMHTWDGETLRLGVTPYLSLEDRAGKALTEVQAADFSLAAAIDAEPVSRPFALFFVRFLREARKGKLLRKFDTLARKLDRGGALDAKKVFKTFGKEKTLLAEFRAWLPTVQEPMVPVFVEWEARAADRVRGSARVVSTCRTREPAGRLSATLHPPATGTIRAGLLLSHVDAKNYTVALLTGTGGRIDGLRVDRLRAGRWTNLLQTEYAASWPRGEPGTVSLVAERTTDGRVALIVDGEKRGSFDVPGPWLGLAVDKCTAEFSAIEITAARD